MTLIAFSTSKTRADILTDTFVYTHNGRHTATASKVYSFPHLDMAYTIGGSSEFSSLWGLEARVLDLHAATFDDFVRQAGPYMREAWGACEIRRDAPVASLIGYSTEANRFKAYQFDAASDFERQDVEAPFIIPAPFDIRPSELELAHARDAFAGESNEAEALDLLEVWAQKPELVAPTTVKGWVQLGKHARVSRAMISARAGMKVFIAGDLFHSVLKRGEYRTNRVHSFNDSGEEFAQLMAETLHPVAQNGPCGCGSGDPCIDCCLTSDPAVACTCGSGKPFVACCSVRAEATSAPRLPGGRYIAQTEEEMHR